MLAPPKLIKPSDYTDQQKAVFEVYLERFGNVSMAANKCRIAEGVANFWAEQIRRKRRGQEEQPFLDDDPDMRALLALADGGRKRPMPPELMTDEDQRENNIWLPDPQAVKWMRETYIDDDAPLLEDEFWFLQLAEIGFYWTTAPNSKAGKTVVATASLGKGTGDAWTKAQIEFGHQQAFGELPDYIVRVDAVFAGQWDDREFCQVIYHELCHSGVKTNPLTGAPSILPTGKPSAILVGHCVEEFTRAVELYGVDVARGDTKGLVAAANKRPVITDEMIERACGPR